MANPKYLYHLTTKDALPDIYQSGIVPKIGPNAAMVSEEQPHIYLCRRRDLPYWKILLDKYIVLRIDVSGIDISEIYEYDNYAEYLCDKPIPAEKLQQVYTEKPKQAHMEHLCLSYIRTLSHNMVNCAKYYHHISPDYITHDFLKMQLENTLNVIKRLDFSQVEKSKIRKLLRHIGLEECGYTLVDMYCNTDRRLYEQLLYYPEDDLTKLRTEMFQFIKTTLKGCLNVNTGGWCY